MLNVWKTVAVIRANTAATPSDSDETPSCRLVSSVHFAISHIFGRYVGDIITISIQILAAGFVIMGDTIFSKSRLSC